MNTNEPRVEQSEVTISWTAFNVPSNIYKISIKIKTNLHYFQWWSNNSGSMIYLEGEYMAEWVKENKNFIMPHIEKAPFFKLIK